MRYLLVNLVVAVCLAGEVLRDDQNGTTYCNTSTGLTEYQFDVVLCGSGFKVYSNRTVQLDSTSEQFLVDGLVSIELVYNESVAFVGIVDQGNASYALFLSNYTTVPLLDLNRSTAGRSAWDPVNRNYWSIGYADLGTQPKFYKIEFATGFTTGFYFIATGERPVDVYWNGTEIIGIVERNFTYYTVAFLLNNRRLPLGPVNGTQIVIDKVAKTVYLWPLDSRWLYLCTRECQTHVDSIQVINNSSKQQSYSEYQNSSTPITQSSTQPVHSQPPISIIILPHSVSISFGDPTVNIPGRLVIGENSIVTLDLSNADLSTGDVLTLYEFSELQGTFAGLEIQSTSCQYYTGEFVYNERTVTVIITDRQDLCTAMGTRIKCT